MSLSPNFKDVHYYCFECEKELERDDFKVAKATVVWECPYCGGDIHLYVHTDEWNYALIRKYANNIDKGELVLIHGDKSGQYHEILNVEHKKRKIKLAIKGYGVAILCKDDYLDCINGTWDSLPEF